MGKKGEVKVDDFNQSSVPSIYAVGDVTDRVNLTPVALMEGMAFAKNIFGYVPLYTADAGFASMKVAADQTKPSLLLCTPRRSGLSCSSTTSSHMFAWHGGMLMHACRAGVQYVAIGA